MRKLSRYKALAKALKADKPIMTPDGKRVLCHRKADERELEAAKVLLELLGIVDAAIEDLRYYSTCETCAYRKTQKNVDKWCKKHEKLHGTRTPAFGCARWKWRGDVDEDS